VANRQSTDAREQSSLPHKGDITHTHTHTHNSSLAAGSKTWTWIILGLFPHLDQQTLELPPMINWRHQERLGIFLEKIHWMGSEGEIDRNY
jgi:hypothetical protein